MTREMIFNVWAPPASRWSSWVKPVLFSIEKPGFDPSRKRELRPSLNLVKRRSLLDGARRAFNPPFMPALKTFFCALLGSTIIQLIAGAADLDVPENIH